MARTRHIQKRMSQRGITQGMVDLACQFGVRQQDKLVINRRGLEQLVDNLRSIERTALKAIDKGGIVVVESDGALVTTYDLDSYDRKKARSSGRQER